MIQTSLLQRSSGRRRHRQEELIDHEQTAQLPITLSSSLSSDCIGTSSTRVASCSGLSKSPGLVQPEIAADSARCKPCSILQFKLPWTNTGNDAVSCQPTAISFEPIRSEYSSMGCKVQSISTPWRRPRAKACPTPSACKWRRVSCLL